MKKRTKVLLWIVGVIVVLVAGARVALGIWGPDLVRDQAQKAVHEKTRMTLALGEVSIVGLTGVELRDIRLTERGGSPEPVAAVDAVRVSLAGIPWPWKPITVDEIEVTNPRAQVVIEPDGELNWTRLTKAPEEAGKPAPETSEGAGAGGTSVVVERVTVKGIAVTFEDRTAKNPQPLTVKDVDLALQREPGSSLAYGYSVRLGDPAWGPTVLAGRVATDPLAVNGKTTDGSLHIDATNLASLPGLPRETLDQVKPSATIIVRSFDYKAGAQPQGEVIVSDLSAQAPGVGPVTGGQLTATVAGGGAKVDIAQLKLLGGIVKGRLESKTLSAASPQLSGHLDLAGLGYHQDEYRAGFDGAVDLGPAAGQDSAGGLTVAVTGKLTAGRQGQQPFESPLAAGATLFPSAPDHPVAVTLKAGEASSPIYLDVAAEYRPADARVAVSRLAGELALSTDMVRRVTGLTPDIVEQMAPSGRIVISSPGLVVDAKHPEQSKGTAEVRSEGLKLRIPGTDRVETLSVVVDVAPAESAAGTEAEPRVLANLRITRPESGGELTAVALAGSSRVDVQKSEIKNLPVTDELLKSLAAILPEKARPVLDRLEDMSAMINGSASLAYDVKKSAVENLLASVTISDLSVAAKADEGATVNLTSATAGAEMKGDAISGSFAGDIFGGRLSAKLAPTEDGGVEATLTTEPGRMLVVEQIPAVWRAKAPMDLSGQVFVGGSMKAARLADLARSRAEVSVALLNLEAAPKTQVGAGAGPGTGAGMSPTPMTPEERAARTLHLDGQAQATIDLAKESVDELVVKLTRLVDGAGGFLLPPPAIVTAGPVSFPLSGMPTQIPLKIKNSSAVEMDSMVSIDQATKRAGVGDLKLLINLGAMPWPKMAKAVADAATRYAPAGRLVVTGGGSVATEGASTLDSALYDVVMDGTDTSWLIPQTGARVKPLDLRVEVKRASMQDPHTASVVTDDPDYGHLDAGAKYTAPQVAFSVDLKQMILGPSIVALTGAPGKQIDSSSGVFNGTVSGTVDVDSGKFLALDGKLTGRDIAMMALGGNVPLESAALDVTMTKGVVTLEKLDGMLADGKLAVTGTVAVLDPTLPISLKMAIERMDVRKLAALAKRPENELTGRLTLSDFTLDGPAHDMNQWKGKGKAHFGEGYLWRLPLFESIRVGLFDGVRAILARKFDPASFRSADADFVIENGKMHFPEATVDSQMVRMVMDGDVFFDRRLDLHVAALIRPQTPAPAGGAEGGGLLGTLGGDIGKILEKLPGTGVPIIGSFYHITGTFDNPKREVDVSRTWQGLTGSALEFLKRDSKTGGGGQTTEPGQTPPATDGSATSDQSPTSSQPATTDEKPQPTPIRDLLELLRRRN